MILNALIILTCVALLATAYIASYLMNDEDD